MRHLCLALILLTLTHSCSAVLDEDVLIVYEDDIPDSHSKLFAYMREAGYKLSFSNVRDTINLDYYGKYLYNQLIIFAPNAKGSSLSVEAVADFVDHGNSVLIAMSESPGPYVRSLAKRFRVGVKGKIVDFHLNHGIEMGQAVVADVPSDLKSVFGENNISNVAFKGVSLSLNEKLVSKSFQFPLLHSSPTSHPVPRATLAAGIQGKNDARVAILGSLDVFSDDYFDQSSENIGNANFSKELIKWTFKDRSRLYYSGLIHRVAGKNIPCSVYIVNDEIEVRIYIREYKDDIMAPFDVDRIQLEVIKVDPVIRLNMKPGPNGMYWVKFKLPDAFGYYKFRVQYQRPGYTRIFAQEMLPVRPLRCAERGQIKEIAYPYYAGALSMMIGIVIMSIIVLYQK